MSLRVKYVVFFLGGGGYFFNKSMTVCLFGHISYGPRYDKTFQGFRQSESQTSLLSYRD